METFGEWLRGQREERRLTREEFAKRVGCSVSALRKIEDGERRPSAQIAKLMANSLDVPASEREVFIRVARGEWGTERLARLSNLAQAPKISLAQTLSRNNLPVLPTPLIGRERELAELSQLLCDPQCRMLTLVGPGGMGKTRLAIESAAQLQSDFADGTYFVSLASVNSPRLLVPVISDSIGFSFRSVTPVDPKTQLLNYLEEKQMLLLLDNMEHLLQEPGVELVAELLAQAPQVKLFVTSREPVNLQSEWVFEVQGLPLPEHEDTRGTSIELFLQCARRAHVGFHATTNDYPAIQQICQLLNGMPLGIELAAAWVRTLTCEEIAAEIERGLDFLSVSARDLPARHRSMRAVFDHSWKLLSNEEQSVFARLSVFQGGFSREAAEQVAGATLSILSSLLIKSMIHRSGEGRYELHDLLRQYAADHLAGQPKFRKEAEERHAHYFMEHFGNQDFRLRSPAQQTAIAELSLEMDNFRAAWNWSVAHNEFDLIESTLRAFETFFDARGWLHDGLDYLDHALEALEKSGKRNPLALGHILVAQSLLLFRLARMAEARTKLEQSLKNLRPLNESHVFVEAISFLGIVLAMMGNYLDALQLFYEGLDLAKSGHDEWFEALNLTEIVTIEIIAGKAENSHERVKAALDAWRAIGDPRFTAFGLNSLSLIAARLGQFEEARAALEESIAINQSVGDRWGLGTAYWSLGSVEQQQDRHTEAISAFQQSQEIFADLGARWDEARVLTAIGWSTFAQGPETEAEKIWRQAIRLAVESHGMPLVLEAIIGIAQVRAKEGNVQAALELLSVVLNHPAIAQETKSRAAKLRAELEAPLTPQELKSLQARSEVIDFDTVIEGILKLI